MFAVPQPPYRNDSRGFVPSERMFAATSTSAAEGDRPREEAAQLERNCPVCTIDKSGNSYAINRLRAADCTGFFVFMACCLRRKLAWRAREGWKKTGGGLARQEACQLFLCIDMNINNRGLATWGQAYRRTQSAWRGPLCCSYI